MTTMHMHAVAPNVVHDVWPWAALMLLGAVHGINPGMGWLFAVALGMQRQERGAVWRALVPLAAGHAAAIAVVAAAVTAIPDTAPWSTSLMPPVRVETSEPTAPEGGPASSVCASVRSVLARTGASLTATTLIVVVATADSDMTSA